MLLFGGPSSPGWSGGEREVEVLWVPLAAVLWGPTLWLGSNVGPYTVNLNTDWQLNKTKPILHIYSLNIHIHYSPLSAWMFHRDRGPPLALCFSHRVPLMVSKNTTYSHSHPLQLGVQASRSVAVHVSRLQNGGVLVSKEADRTDFYISLSAGMWCGELLHIYNR